MRFKSAIFWLCIGLLVTSSVRAAENYEKPVSGMEWLEKSIPERLERVRVSMLILHTNGVPVEGSANDYYNALDKKIRREPSIADTDLTNILASVIYDTDPASREVLNKFRRV